MMNFMFKSMMMISLVVLLAGCSGTPTPTTRTVVSEELEGAPDWVLKGTDGDKNTLSAIGSVVGTNNVGLARSAALGRARTELSRQLDLQVKAMLKDYQSTTTGGGAFGEMANDEQEIVDVSRQITELNLSGTKQENIWISKTGTYYVLVSLDVDDFKNTVKKMGHLSSEIRKAVSDRADKAFADLDTQ